MADKEKSWNMFLVISVMLREADFDVADTVALGSSILAVGLSGLPANMISLQGFEIMAATVKTARDMNAEAVAA